MNIFLINIFLNILNTIPKYNDINDYFIWSDIFYIIYLIFFIIDTNKHAFQLNTYINKIINMYYAKKNKFAHIDI